MISVNKVTALSLGRVAVGAAALARPELLGRALGADPATNAQLTYLVRLFGAREVALGAVTLTSSGSGRRTALLAGIAVDAADAATGVLGLRDADVAKAQGGALVGVAGGAVGVGLLGLVGHRRDAKAAAKAAAQAQVDALEVAKTSGRRARRKLGAEARRAQKKAGKAARKTAKKATRKTAKRARKAQKQVDKQSQRLAA